MRYKYIVLTILLTFCVTTNAFAMYPPYASNKILEQVNYQRERYNLQPLILNQSLNNVATARANDLAIKSYFSHTSPNGFKWYFWFGIKGYRFLHAGENLAVKFKYYNNIVPAWMASPTHRANILSSNFTETGIAFAEGYMDGKYVIFVVQEFARPYFTK